MTMAMALFCKRVITLSCRRTSYRWASHVAFGAASTSRLDNFPPTTTAGCYRRNAFDCCYFTTDAATIQAHRGEEIEEVNTCRRKASTKDTLEATAAKISTDVLALVKSYTNQFHNDDGESKKQHQDNSSTKVNKKCNQDGSRDDGGGAGAHLASSFRSGASGDDSAPKGGNDNRGLVYCNNRLNMDDISVIGFDYDYTLCRYKRELQELIYNEAKKHLLEKSGYPSQLDKCQYDPNFAIRGLMFDKQTGLFLQLSFTQRVTPGRVFLGKRRIEDQNELLRLYGGAYFVSSEYVKTNIVWLNDLFSLSEACLLAGTQIIYECIIACCVFKLSSIQP